jgi:hypothetical protein
MAHSRACAPEFLRFRAPSGSRQRKRLATRIRGAYRPVVRSAIEQSEPVIVNLYKGGLTVVSREDADIVAESSWYQTSHGRVRGGKDDKYLHRIIAKRMGISGEVDHINGNPLDNRRSNIRGCTRTQNLANVPKHESRGGTSRFKGVSRKGNKWVAQIKVANKKQHLGYFDDEREAALAYDAAAREAFAGFAKLNFPESRAARVSRSDSVWPLRAVQDSG